MELLRIFEPVPPAQQAEPERIGDLVAGSLAKAAASFLAHDTDRTPQARDPEDLHAARVALRRIRSHLRTFRSVVDAEWAHTARADLGWFAHLLGEVRNLDVLAERIAERAGNAEPVALHELLGAVSHARNEAVFRLAEARVLPRYTAVLRQVDTLVARSLPLTDHGEEAIQPALSHLLRRPWRNVRDAARTSRKSPSETTLHALRIRSKELRYASELASEALGDRAKRLARAAQAVQDRLGEHRDALSAAAFMTRAATDRPASAFFAGQLVVVERIAAERSLDDLGNDLRNLRQRWRSFERSLSR